MASECVPTKHKDGSRSYKTVLTILVRLKDGLRWFKTVLYHLSQSLCFVSNGNYSQNKNNSTNICKCWQLRTEVFGYTDATLYRVSLTHLTFTYAVYRVLVYYRRMLDPPSTRMRKHSRKPKMSKQYKVLTEVIDTKVHV